MDAMSDTASDARRLTIQTALHEGAEVEVSVINSGTGIPQHKLGEIFDTFYTTKAQGTGLGLSIVRTIVESYGRSGRKTGPEEGRYFALRCRWFVDRSDRICQRSVESNAGIRLWWTMLDPFFDRRGRSFAASSSRNGCYHMNPGTIRSGLDCEIAAKLACSRSDAIDANPWTERRPLLHTSLHACAVSVVSDNQVQPTGDPSQIDGDAGCRGVAMDVGQRFLNNAKERPLHVQRQRIDVRTRPQLDGEP